MDTWSDDDDDDDQVSMFTHTTSRPVTSPTSVYDGFDWDETAVGAKRPAPKLISTNTDEEMPKELELLAETESQQATPVLTGIIEDEAKSHAVSDDMSAFMLSKDDDSMPMGQDSLENQEPPMDTTSGIDFFETLGFLEVTKERKEREQRDKQRKQRQSALLAKLKENANMSAD